MYVHKSILSIKSIFKSPYFFSGFTAHNIVSFLLQVNFLYTRDRGTPLFKPLIVGILRKFHCIL